MLPCNVPEGDVDGADRAHDGGAPKVREAVHVLPVMLDAQWVFPYQVAAELLNRGLGCFEEAPRAGLADACYSGVGMDLDEEKTIYGQGFDSRDLHGCASQSNSHIIIPHRRGRGEPSIINRRGTDRLCSRSPEILESTNRGWSCPSTSS